MPAHAALDVSRTTTSIHVVDEAGTCLWRGKAPTCPDAIAAALAPFGADLVRVGLETGCWTTWLWHGLRDRNLPAVCMDARQAKAALSLKINKTDANDARGLAHLLRTGLFREVRVKSWGEMRARALVRARRTVLRVQLDLANAVRGAARAPSARCCGPRAGREASRPRCAPASPTGPTLPSSSCRCSTPGLRRADRSPGTTGWSGQLCAPTRAAAC